MDKLATFLTLSRTGQVPTVWSNCLAGWLLAGGEYPGHFLKALIGSTLLYLGGGFLNDAFDAEYDRHHGSHRPIPSGSVTEAQVWRWGLYLLAGGGLLLFAGGVVSGIIGLCLIFCIILHNAVHRLPGIAPSLLGACRFLIYCIGTSATSHGLPGEVLWCGLVSGAYAAGVAYASRQANDRGIDRYWPVLLMGFPLLLAYVMNSSIYNPYREPAIWLAVLVCLWTLRGLRGLWNPAAMETSAAMASLTATLVFIDWLALASMPRSTGLIFLLLFVLVLALGKAEVWAHQYRKTQLARNLAHSPAIGT